MIRLRVLGDVTLQRADGGILHDVLAQPKRVALLVYLALGNGTFHRRDVLLALFWPELDQQHARAALSQALLFLRRALGDAQHEVLVSRGNDQVAVDTTRLWCDALEFRRQLRAGAVVDALAMYRGDFLHGFHAGCSPEFEQWVDQTARAIQREAAEAALRASVDTERAGQLEAAVAFARRASELSDGEEQSVRRLITLFDKTGDRAAALLVYEELSLRLRSEYGAAPAPETIAAIQRVRARAAPATNTSVAASDLRVTAAASPERRRRTQRIAAAVIAAVGLTSVAGLASVFPRRSPPPASRPRSQPALPSAAHRPTPRAYAAFLKGHYEFEQWPRLGASEAALRYYTEAVTDDPAFALGYAEIAQLVLGSMSVKPQDAQAGEAAAARALALDSTLADAHVAMALSRFRAWRWDEAEREFRRAIAMNPELPAAHRFYSQLLRIERRFDEAIAEARTAERLQPLSLPTKVDVGSAQFVASRFDDAIETWNDILQLDPTNPLAAYALGLGYGIQGRPAELRPIAERAVLLAAGTEYEMNATFLMALAYAEEGRRRQADSVISVMQARFAGAARLPGLSAIVMLREGRNDAAMSWLELGYERRYFAIANATSEPWFDPLRSDPRFRRLRKRLRLP